MRYIDEDSLKEIYADYLYMTRPEIFGGVSSEAALAVLALTWGVSVEDLEKILDEEQDYHVGILG